MNKWQSAAARRIREISGTSSVEAGIPVIVERLIDGVPCPPTDLDELMRKLNVAGSELDEDMLVPGELRRWGHKLKIYLIPGLGKGRTRFTIAHELGHAIFESSGRGCPRHGEELEHLCDKIAAEILMPRTIFKSLAGHRPTIDRVIELSRLFQTSLPATFKRTAELYGVRAFEVDNGTINWSAGISSRGFAGAGSSFKQGIKRAMDGERGSESVELNFGSRFTKWRMEWRCLDQEKRAVFLLTP